MMIFSMTSGWTHQPSVANSLLQAEPRKSEPEIKGLSLPTLLQKGLGQQGCGAFDLLFPDTAFHHVYVERDCYYLLRDKHSIGILGRQQKPGELYQFNS